MESARPICSKKIVNFLQQGVLRPPCNGRRAMQHGCVAVQVGDARGGLSRGIDGELLEDKRMIHIDRRAWLRSVSLAVGGLGASRLLGAPSSSPSPAGATSPAAAHAAVRKLLLKASG
jgi:hypothetical protein